MESIVISTRIFFFISLRNGESNKAGFLQENSQTKQPEML